jgi:hypothetical protein
MSFDVRPPDQPGAYDATARIAPAPKAAAASFARVYELQEARARRQAEQLPIAGDRIPAEVWDEVDAAARLFEHLRADGRRMMFDTDRLTGKTVASLLEADGSIQPLTLTEAVEAGQHGVPGTPAAEGPANVA